MHQLLNLVLLGLVFVTVQFMAQATELCQQDAQWKRTQCLNIRNNNYTNNNLNQLLKNKAVNVSSQFQVPQNVTSLEDFYVLLVNYRNTLQEFNSSMRAYMKTPEYFNESRVTEVVIFTNAYFQYLYTDINYLQPTIVYLLQKINVSSIVTPTINGTNVTRNQAEIYAETYYVTSQMLNIFSTWFNKCVCASA